MEQDYSRGDSRLGCPVLRTHYLRHATTVRHFLSFNDYNQYVRNYTTQRIKGGMQFTCIHCPHSVRTVDFDVKDGNLRTQAATALNQHAAEAHNEPMIISSPNVQQRIWRS